MLKVRISLILIFLSIISISSISCKSLGNEQINNNESIESEKEEEIAMFKEIKEIEDLVNSVIEEGNLYSGIAIAVADSDKLLYEFYAGQSIISDTEVADNYDREKVFNIGSITKPITASLIMKLQEKGKLNINDKVQEYLPRYKFDDVTILNLMTHTAGYDSTKVGVVWPGSKMEYSNYLNSVYNLPKAFNVNENSLYFTNGYSLLLEIIEKQSQMSIEEYAGKILFEPLNMSFTHYDVAKADAENFVLPYATNSSTGKQTFETYLRYTKKPSRGFFSTNNSSSTVGHPGFSGGAFWIDKENNITAVIITNSTKMGTQWMQFGNNEMKKISDAILNHNWKKTQE